ncbi:MAG: SDR family oxidoreductase [Streptosporangiales bacterium]|nr:SDR family oxidoreductase [Streptosporangiales bacterium]
MFPVRLAISVPAGTGGVECCAHETEVVAVATPTADPAQPSFALTGRRALVTGGSKGLGYASALALAGAGADVVIAARNEVEVEQASAAIAARHGRCTPLVLDVTDIDGCRNRLADLDPFDVLVNSAGRNRPEPFLEVSPDAFDDVLGLNLRSAFFVSQLVAQRLVAAERGGAIIHMSSQMGHVGGANRSVYCASKWGLEGLTRAMAIELAPYGIRVNALAPTFIETPMTQPFFADETFRSSVLDKIKLGRLGTLDDIGGAVVFLASPASALMTGASLLLDGGWTAD